MNYTKASAQLIATSPELLEELKFIIDHCIESQYSVDQELENRAVLYDHQLDRIRNLIAKAEGDAE